APPDPPGSTPGVGVTNWIRPVFRVRLTRAMTWMPLDPDIDIAAPPAAFGFSLRVVVVVFLALPAPRPRAAAGARAAAVGSAAPAGRAASATIRSRMPTYVNEESHW